MNRLTAIWTGGFVVWVVAFSAAAYAWPGVFTSLRAWIPWGLAVVMLGMGVTLEAGDFARVLRMPRAVACGVVGQFLIMPLVGAGLARWSGLEAEVAVGLIIVGACPGGTASNVIAYLARGDVALSVTMTAVSTVLAVALTPWLIWRLGGSYVAVDAGALFRDVVLIVLLPTVGGVALRALLGKRMRGALEVLPAVSVLVIVLIIATVVALSRERIAQGVGVVGALVVTHNVSGLLLGYLLAWACRLPVAARRTVAIEVGMQNSGLGAALAMKHFVPAAALAASLFSVTHNLTGAVVAAVWRAWPVEPGRQAFGACRSSSEKAVRP